MIDTDHLHPRNALVVDDDPGINRLLQVRLKNLGFDVRTAANGEEALDRIHTAQPDLILLDVSMPGMGGMEVLDTIRRQQLDIAVIMTTAFGSERVAIEALRNGANDYLRKPFEADEFRAVISRTSSRLLLERQNEALRQQLQAELRRAAGIQASLLPEAPPDIPGYGIVAACVAAREVGGDFYDWQVLPNGHLNLTVGDVMGKGLPAALLMATVRAALRSAVQTTGPAAALDAVGRALATDLERTSSFVTLFQGELVPESGEFRFADAGHGLAAHVRCGARPETLGHTGLPLGVDSAQCAIEGSITLSPGDLVVICSDGIAESFDELAAAVGSFRNPPANLAQAMARHLLVTGEGTQVAQDDRTILVIHRMGEQ